MPFDYDSFMQGVITGLKLGRVPGGRRPPVPSGRYILTESGTHVLSEQPNYGDVSVLDSSTWFALTTPKVISGVTYTEVIINVGWNISGSSPIPDYIIMPSKFFYVVNTASVVQGKHLVVFTNSPSIESTTSCRVFARLRTADGVETSYSYSSGSPRKGVTADGNSYYYDLLHNDVMNDNTIIPADIEEVLYAYGVEQGVENYMNGLQYLPLITEGG